MTTILIVTEPFDGYLIGQTIEDKNIIKIIAESENASKVRKSELKSQDDFEKWHRQKTIHAALALDLPDGVFRIVFFNSQHPQSAADKRIDPYELFSASPRSEVEHWVARSQWLMASNYEVGDALVRGAANYDVIRDQYLKCNPGFSEATYAHAIHLGASKAVH